MIEFLRNGRQLIARVRPKWPISDTTFDFTFTANDEWAATLLHWNVVERLSEELKKAREVAYRQGWKDAKAKKGAKQTWFANRWERD